MVICSYCKQERMANAMPCNFCGAPASMAMQQNNFGSAWSHGPVMQQAVPSAPSAPSAPTDSSVPPFASFSSLSSNMPSHYQAEQYDASRALVPFSQQGAMGLQPAAHSTHAPTVPLILGQQNHETSLTIPMHEDMIYVPPMYTKPRPIIPRYRVISGLLSFLIVCLVLCAGASYYAKTSGTLNLVNRFITGSGNTPPSIHANNVSLPDPPNKIDRGPAYNIIPSATTTSHLIQDTYIAVQTDKIFRPDEDFALTYSVSPPGKTTGKVIIKWYTNNVLFQTITSNAIQGGNSTSGVVKIAYSEQVEGSVELWWQDQTSNQTQLAQRLYFVVRN